MLLFHLFFNMFYLPVFYVIVQTDKVRVFSKPERTKLVGRFGQTDEARCLFYALGQAVANKTAVG